MACGIYAIKNTISGLIYVGSSRDISQRKATHLDMLRKDKHTNTHLQNAFNKYGEPYFRFEVLELCTPNELLFREQAYIESLRPLYNFRPADQSGKYPTLVDRNDWHQWVYGGQKNPIHSQGRR